VLLPEKIAISSAYRWKKAFSTIFNAQKNHF
jgi:hypothetical protein